MPRALSRFGVFAAVSLATRAVLAGVPFVHSDEAIHLLGSWTLLDGRRLYVDFADHKPPLLYAYYALPQLLFGRGMGVVRWFTTLVTLPLTALAASAFYGHDRRGLASGLLLLVAGASYLGHDVLAVNAEVVMLLPAAWALVAVRDAARASGPGAVAAGVLLGLAALVKYPAGLWVAAPAIALVPERVGLRTVAARALRLAAGFAMPMAAAVLAFVGRGDGDAFLYWNITHNLRYAANPIPAGEVALRVATSVLPWLVSSAALWWAWSRARRRFESRYQAALLAALVLLAVPAVITGGRFFGHYFVPLYLPLALAAAPSVVDLAARPPSPAARVALTYAGVMFVAFTVANAILYHRTGAYEETRPVFRRVADGLRADPCARSGSLFVWGFAPQFYAESGLVPASRFVIPFPQLSGYVPGNRAAAAGAIDTRDLVRPEHWEWLMADLRTSRPAIILDTSPANLHRWGRYPLHAFPPLFDFVHAGYDLAGAVGHVHVWRRKDCPAR